LATDADVADMLAAGVQDHKAPVLLAQNNSRSPFASGWRLIAKQATLEMSMRSYV
jgi:hypothetical protein